MVGEVPLLGHGLLIVSSHGGRAQGALWVSFIRALIPFMRVLALSPDHLPKTLPPNTATFRG